LSFDLLALNPLALRLVLRLFAGLSRGLIALFLLLVLGSAFRPGLALRGSAPATLSRSLLRRCDRLLLRSELSSSRGGHGLGFGGSGVVRLRRECHASRFLGYRADRSSGCGRAAFPGGDALSFDRRHRPSLVFPN